MADLGNSWEQYQKLVMAELERHSKSIQELNTKLVNLEIEFAMLKVKASLLGGAAGVVPIILQKLVLK